MSNWTDFVKEFARKHNVSYGCAMAMPECSIEYKKLHPKKPTKKQIEAAIDALLLNGHKVDALFDDYQLVVDKLTEVFPALER